MGELSLRRCELRDITCQKEVRNYTNVWIYLADELQVTALLVGAELLGFLKQQ